MRNIEKHHETLLSWTLDTRNNPQETKSFGEFAKILGVGYQTVQCWADKGEIPCESRGSAPTTQGFVIPSQVLEALAVAKDVQAKSASHPLDYLSNSGVFTAPPVVTTEDIRQKMFLAAKNAARDECLLAADRAKKAGLHAVRAQHLEDYIHMEEGLKMIFEERHFV